MKIIEAKSQAQLETARQLFHEYQNFIGVDLCFQDFAKELATLPGKYALPRGTILLAKVDDEIAGCVAVRPINLDVCEMKRLYVRPDFRGRAIGEGLAAEIVSRARAMGYQKMQLDTLERLQPAMAIYAKLGFRKIEPYYANPLDEVVYWELRL